MDILRKEVKEDKVPLSNDYCEGRIPRVEDVTPNERKQKDLNILNANNNNMLFPKILKMGNVIIHPLNKSYKYRQRVHLSDNPRVIYYTFLLALFIFAISAAVSVYLLGYSKSPSQISIDNNVVQNKEKLKLSYSNYPSVSFTQEKYKKAHQGHEKNDLYPKGLTENMKNILKDKREGDVIDSFFDVMEKITTKPRRRNPGKTTILYDNVYWGPQIEEALPQGFGHLSTANWERYVNHSEIIKMEIGCGRMQNRLVTFKDGVQACVRYRQNTDQIQGEIFSFYLGKFLNLNNLAPSVVKVIDPKDKLWSNVAEEIIAAQWNSNRAVVLTQYIPSLEAATIPDVFKPTGRHLNKFDVIRLVIKDNTTVDRSHVLEETLRTNDNPNYKSELEPISYIDMNVNNKTLLSLVELAQWADLIVFDYLTANLDRIVNNLFNYQWNVNIMDGPAHNLARQIDTGLLVFLDNESGLLHGYRLLKKYNVYHTLMLENLCVFRKSTVDAIREMYVFENLSAQFDGMYHSKNDAVTRDVLPPLPLKNKKILYERLGKIVNQVKKCEQQFSSR